MSDFDYRAGRHKQPIWKVILKVIGALLLIATIFVGIYTLYARHRLNNFLKTATETTKETQSYSVATLKTSSFNEISRLKDKKIGFLSTNPYLEKAEKKLREAVDYRTGLENDPEALLENLRDGNDFLAIALESNYFDELSGETSPTSQSSETSQLDDLKIIYTFEITLDDEIAEGDETPSPLSEPFVAYISGSDSRGDLSQTARSDVNILAVVNPKTAKILLINTPRDYYVQLHGTTGTKDKLTHAGVYGTKMSKNTLEDLYGVNVDYTVKVGFKAVSGIVNAIDGIDLDSDQELTLKTEGKDPKTCHFIVGVQHVDGDCALRFARERKSYASGDRHRGENQQQVIEKVVSKISSNKGYLLKWAEILGAVEGSLEISAPFEDVSKFVRDQIKSPKNWQVESIAVDGTGSMQPTYSMGSRPLYVMIPDEATVAAAKAKIAEYLK
ncbi:LCP family protein [Candidatus Saccharibacteria bacterium]|nr:LCP family protein [Candidatus Saccharibacteria bacterium]